MFNMVLITVAVLVWTPLIVGGALLAKAAETCLEAGVKVAEMTDCLVNGRNESPDPT